MCYFCFNVFNFWERRIFKFFKIDGILGVVFIIWIFDFKDDIFVYMLVLLCDVLDFIKGDCCCFLIIKICKIWMVIVKMISV